MVVGLLGVVALLNYLDRLMITAMRDAIRSDVPMTDAQFGLLTSVFLWTYAATSPVGGYLADRFGRRVIIVVSLILWSAATLGSGVAASFQQLLLTRALMGISEACYVPAALALIADYHRGSTRSLATGLHMTGLYIGAALGGAAGFVADSSLGWRFGFHAFGLAGIVYGVILFALLRDAPDRTADRRHEPSPQSGPTRFDLRPFLTTAFLLLLFVNVFVGAVNWAVYGWMPTYLKERFSLGSGAAGLSATGYIQVASFAGVLAAGYLADRWSRTRPGARSFTPAVGFLVAGPFLFAAASTDFLPAAIAGLVIFGLGRGAFDANHMPLLREIVPERHSATGYGLLNLVSTAVGGIMVYAGGALLDAQIGLATVFKGAGLALCAAGLLLARIPSPARTEVDRQFAATQAAAERVS
jgi:MFS family permease